MPDGYAQGLVDVAGDPSARLVVVAPRGRGWNHADRRRGRAFAQEPISARFIANARTKMTACSGRGARTSPLRKSCARRSRICAWLRKAKKIIGAGVGQSGDTLQKLASGANEKLFDALLLVDAAPSKPPLGKNAPFTIEIFGSDAYWRSVPRAGAARRRAKQSARVFFWPASRRRVNWRPIARRRPTTAPPSRRGAHPGDAGRHLRGRRHAPARGRDDDGGAGRRPRLRRHDAGAAREAHRWSGAKVGRHKTSMLQDVEAGRTLEIDALLGAVVELARLSNTPTPHLDAVYALTRLMANVAEAERGGGPVVLRAAGG